jgi:hypothetical protein
VQRKIEIESEIDYIKGKRSFRRFCLPRLDNVHVGFGNMAIAFNMLKAACIRLATFLALIRNKKKLAKTRRFSPASFLI